MIIFAIASNVAIFRWNY